MFEKEAKERAEKLEEDQTLGVYDNEEDYERDRGWNEGEVCGYEEGFKDGAEFGYNKAKEDADKMKSRFLDLCNLKDMRIEELEKALERNCTSRTTGE